MVIFLLELFLPLHLTSFLTFFSSSSSPFSGFDECADVIVFAGTNRVDVLDKALLRPGRFDRHITVDPPDIKGRKAIFMIYLKKLKMTIDLEALAERLAAQTPGFVGEFSKI
jgi:ATP-dependent Zn protease